MRNEYKVCLNMSKTYTEYVVAENVDHAVELAADKVCTREKTDYDEAEVLEVERLSDCLEGEL